MRTTGIFILLSASLLWGCSNNDPKNGKVATNSDSTQLTTIYQCPMDCEKGKTYDKAGKCPVCEMDLELKTGE